MAKITIKDIASYAKVSTATVSRVLATPDKVAPATRAIVEDAVKKLGYYPSIIAQGMHHKIKNIGVILNRNTEDSFFSPYLSEVLRGLVKSAKDLGYFIQILTCERDSEGCDELVSLYRSQRVDGYILLSSKVEDIFIQTLINAEIPFILHGNTDDNDEQQQIYTLDIDNVAAAQELVNYLINLGHRHIAMINSSTDYIYNQERLQGYKLALNNAGIVVNADFICETAENLDEFGHEVKEFLLHQPQLTAVVCKSDISARQLIMVANSLGMHVPHDLSIVCFNETYAAKMAQPQLTTISIPIYQIGIELLKSMVAILNHQQLCHRQLFPYSVIIGNSCQMPAK